MRKNHLRSLLLLLLLSTPSLMYAATVTRGPYLQLDTGTSIVIKWRTDVATDSRVRYGTSSGSLTQIKSAGASVTDHEITLTGLTQGQRYYYDIGTTTTVLAGDNTYTFRTSTNSNAATTRVWALGDAGTATANQINVRNAFYTWNNNAEVAAVLLLGDNAYNSGTDTEYQNAMFNIYPNSLKQMVFWSTIGNHDTAGSSNPALTIPYFKIFNNPTNAEAGGTASGTEKYYSFNHGPIHFLCLDSMTSDRSAGGAMALWAKADLAANTKPWVVAFWHHPPYTKGSHNSDTETNLKQMRENILPILENEGVDLVLGGHSHSYERSYFIDGHYGLSGTFANSHKKAAGNGSGAGYSKAQESHGGAVYAVPGSSGKTSGGTLDHPAMVTSLNELGSLCFEVKYNTLQAWMIRSDGVVRDTFSIVKITVPGPPPNVPTITNGTTTTPTFSGTTTPNATIHIYSDGVLIGTTTANGTGAWSYTVTTPLTYGTHVITITSTPPGGVPSTPSTGTNITVDSGPTTPPVVATNQESNGSCGLGSGAAAILLLCIGSLSLLRFRHRHI